MKRFAPTVLQRTVNLNNSFQLSKSNGSEWWLTRKRYQGTPACFSLSSLNSVDKEGSEVLHDPWDMRAA